MVKLVKLQSLVTKCCEMQKKCSLVMFVHFVYFLLRVYVSMKRGNCRYFWLKMIISGSLFLVSECNFHNLHCSTGLQRMQHSCTALEQFRFLTPQANQLLLVSSIGVLAMFQRRV